MRIFPVLLFLIIIFKTEAQSSVLNRADSLYINGNYSKAIEAYKAYDDQTEVNDRIAKAYVAIGNYDAALQYYKMSLEANPRNGLVLYEYAKLLSKTKKFEASIEAFNNLMNIDYRNPNYHYEMGLAIERMDDSTAINRYRSAYDLDPTHQKAIFKIAKHYLQKRNHSYAEKYIDKGLESYENNVELISLKAQSYYLQDYYTKARDWFQKLIDLGESSEFIHEKLSLCHGQNSDYELAIEQRKRALKYNPYNANVIFVIGTYYKRLQNYTEAEKYIRQALAMKDVPLDYEYQELGVVLNWQNKHKEAIEVFEKSQKENPQNIQTAFFIITTKDKYYADIDTKIKLYEDFKEKHKESFYSKFAARRISELKEEKFLKAQD
ncbi:Tetratricopeptide repeat-containing protein [Formosa sp. Hel1_31_208]|uniref:tetratricopeptide repeat protein n=1 Tax=Formosa sp. Hel1_31_208 TaxID=1798225 RepID=UPI00087AFCBD|nr:tetratricopeptide repeat protein [Formosa sp. Hel1_31_208]SDR85525.1 Tetratricopeptide repeat-containing protein [Formosa sp. Hel1_31_208]